MTITRNELIDLRFAPEHWNPVCACRIPEAWEGIVAVNDPLSPCETIKIMGDSRKQVIAICQDEGIDVPAHMID